MALEINLIDGPARSVELTRLGSEAIITVDGKDHRANLDAHRGGGSALTLDTRTEEVYAVVAGDTVWVHAFGRAWELALTDPVQRARAGAVSDDTALAPMPGTVITVAVAAGEQVQAGQQLVVIESMKMQSEIVASREGVIERVFVEVGDTFDRGAPLVALTAQDAEQGEGEA
jgi:acetyl/propionyl-CoA carboxylase alpha subunit